MSGIVERDALMGNLLDKVDDLEARIRTLETTHPGLPGQTAGKLAYYDVDGDLAIPDGGNLLSLQNASECAVYGYHGLTTPLTSTDWDGDLYSTTAKTLIDLSAAFSAPAGIKAVDLQVGIYDADSLNNTCYIILAPNDVAGQGKIHSIQGEPSSVWRYASMIVNCDENGDIYYQISASGAGTLGALIQIWGYWL